LFNTFAIHILQEVHPCLVAVTQKRSQINASCYQKGKNYLFILSRMNTKLHRV